MSEWIKCDKCNKITQADSSGDKRYKIGVDGFDGYSVFHLCEWCLRSFYLDFLGCKWNDNESQYVPQESEGKGMVKRKCKNPKFDVIVCCQGQPNHYYCATLIGALIEYGYQYLQKRKYETMNFSLKQVLNIYEAEKE